jgi:hypothetical protein
MSEIGFRERLPFGLVAIDMGYGHLRAARALADATGLELLHADRSPLAAPEEQAWWRRSRGLYEIVSRASQAPLLGRPVRSFLDWLTSIPHLYPYRDQSAPTPAALALERLGRRGLGRGLVEYMQTRGVGLLTTFYAPAVLADGAGAGPIVCVATDTDVNRVWVRRHAAETDIHYCAPSERVVRRLRAYGVPASRIHFTGFPLPLELTGGAELEILRRNLAARLVRLDPKRAFRDQYRQELAHFFGPLPREHEGEPPLVTFAVGGAGAQIHIAKSLLFSLRQPILDRRLRLALVAGVRSEVAAQFRAWVVEERLDETLGEGLEIVHEASFDAYYTRFNALLERTDVLWTKPSELVFYGALGIPLVFAPPVGVHERCNRRWAIQRGAGLKQENPLYAIDWLREWLRDGTLAGTAWSGYVRLPKFGTPRILDLVAELAGARMPVQALAG